MLLKAYAVPQTVPYETNSHPLSQLAPVGSPLLALGLEQG